MSKAIDSVKSTVGDELFFFDPGIAIGTAFGIEMSKADYKFWSGLLYPEIDDDFGDPNADKRLTTDANRSRQIIYGTAVVGGQIKGYTKVIEGEDEYDMFAILIAGHQCQSVSIYEIEGKKPDEFEGLVEAQFDLGTQTAANAFALEYLHGWTAAHIGFNQTMAFVKIKRDPDVFTSIGEVKFIVDGKLVYDVRKDSTMGGAGAHRKNDPTTYEWSQNPILCAYDYARLHGHRPIKDRRIPWDFVALAANYCDEQAQFKDTDDVIKFETRFTCNGVLNNGMKTGDGLSMIMSSMGAKLYRPGGRIFIKPSMYIGAANITLTPADFIEQPNYQPHRPIKERINTVSAKYLEPGLKYELTDAPVIDNASYIAKDGSSLPAELRLHMTTKSTVANRIQRHLLERSQAGFITQGTLKKLRLDIVPGSVVRYVDTASNIDKEFIVENYQPDFSKQTTQITLEEESPLLYPDGFIPATADLTPNTTLPDPTEMLPVQAIAYTATPNDSWRQGFLTWTHPAPRSVTQYVYLMTDDPEDSFTNSDKITSNKLDINNVPSGAYQIFISAQNRFDKSSTAVPYSFNVGLPNTPVEAVHVDVLPGRAHLVAPTAPNPSASYQWRYSFEDDFNNAIDGGTNTAITVTNTPHGGTLYVWYRLVDGDLSDVSWLQVVVPNLIGIGPDVITPDFVIGIELPGLPGNILDTFNWLNRALNDQQYYGEELAEGQAGLLEDIVAANQGIAEVDFRIDGVQSTADDASARAQTALAAITSESQARALLEQQVNTSFDNITQNYIRQVDLFTSAGAARASALNSLQTDFNNLDVAGTVNASIDSFQQIAFGYEDEDGDWVEGAAFLQSFNQLRLVRNNEQISVFEYFEIIEDELGAITGEIQFAVNNNGELTGIFIEGSETASNIIFASETTQFVNTDGDLLLGLNSVTNEFEFHGSGTFSGKLSTPTIEMIGTNIMKLESMTPFGPENLTLWKGFITTSNYVNNVIITSQLTKANSLACEFDNGDIYTGANAEFAGLLSGAAIRAGSALIYTDDDRRAPLTFSDFAFSKSYTRVNRVNTLPVIVSPSYGAVNSYHHARCAFYKTDIQIEVLYASDSDHNISGGYVRIEVTYRGDGTEAWHNVASDIYSESTTTNPYDVGTLPFLFWYTTRDDIVWKELIIKVYAGHTQNPDSRPVALQSRYYVFTQAPSARTSNAITSDANASPVTPTYDFSNFYSGRLVP